MTDISFKEKVRTILNEMEDTYKMLFKTMVAGKSKKEIEDLFQEFTEMANITEESELEYLKTLMKEFIGDDRT